MLWALLLLVLTHTSEPSADLHEYFDSSRRQYEYMDDLILLDACRPVVPTRLPLCMEKVHCPLPWHEWEHCLATHLDQRFRQYISDGLHYGFRVGFNYHHNCRKSHVTCPQPRTNPR